MKNVAASGPQGSAVSRSKLAMLSAATLLAVLVANRAAAKIGVGPIYLVDVLIALNFFYVVRWACANFTTYKYPTLILSVALSWLLFEQLDKGLGDHSLRRFAMAVYLFIPAVIEIQGHALYRLIERRPLTISAVVTVMTVAGFVPNLSPTISAQVLAFLAIVTWFGSNPKRRMKALLILGLFQLVASGATSDGAFYRTPIIGLSAAIAASLTVSALAPIGGQRRASATVAILLATPLLLGTLLMFSSTPLVGQFVSGAAGLFGVDMSTSAVAPARARGDSAGTAETRAVFWRAIIDNSLTSPATFAFGNGHAQSFFEKTQPYDDFVDPELLEPHNSFMGIFYRYGILGLSLLLLFMWRFVIKASTKSTGTYKTPFSAAVYVLALVFAFFEVVLEGPHGAVIFWIMWLAPRFACEPNRSATE